MAEIAAGFIGPTIEVVKWVAAPIIRQFNYLCCFTSNIARLKNEGEKLKVTEGDLQGKVDRARDDLQVISSEVESWLKNSMDTKDEMDVILNEVTNVDSGCLKLRAHYSLSKRAKKLSDRLKELRGQCKFDAKAISNPGPPTATQVVPIGYTYEFESRKKIERDIMKILKLGNVNMIGIYGMGGLGKTTMAKRIMNIALKEHVFEEVVMTVVSQPLDKLKTQVEIGGSLGLKLEGETSQARAQKLHARLSGTKRILLVLDDVWERLVLEDIGIPCNHKRCTILLTSRNRDVFSEMDVQAILRMEVLSKEDAWFLFEQRAGTCVDNTRLNSIANEVVNECKGLPIALTTVGSMLKDKMDVRIWKDALRKLRQCDPNIPGFLANIYNPLKLSYDGLDSVQKYVFLLCCLYPEDVDIPLERLTYFSMGLGIFEGGITNLEDARNSMCSLASMLKSRSLLLDSKRGDDYVRMHDVVRDVCIFIAKQETNIGCNDCTWISSFQRLELPSSRLGFSSLRLIFWICDSANEEFKLDDNFFEGIKDLYVLCIERYLLTSLPRKTQSLKNLKTLVLVSCLRLETLSVVGELVNLEIVICYNCYRIKELPIEMKGLNQLKLLDLTGCENLIRIGRGIISSLVRLEELKMRGSFKKWEAEDREEKENVGVRELEALTKLRCLEIDIEDPALAMENIRLSSKIDRFDIRFSASSNGLKKADLYPCNKKMLLWLEKKSCLGHWIDMQLLRDTEYLCLGGNGANNVELAKIENIRWLELGECEKMEKIVTTTMNEGGVFSSIECLRLFKLPKLEEIWDGRGSLNSFQNLKELVIYNLPALKQIWKGSNIGNGCLSQLQVLRIKKCEMMQQVIDDDDDGKKKVMSSSGERTLVFPNLEELYLESLPKFASFCEWKYDVELPSLRELKIRRCPNMKQLWKSSSVREKSLFPQLQVLSIWNCKMMEHVIKDDEEEKGLRGGEQILLFPKLLELHLEDLQKLVSFCEWKCEIDQLSALRKLEISWCNNMKQLWKSDSPRNECLPQLLELRIEDCRLMEQVFLWNGEEQDESNHITKRFPKLKDVELENLPNLTSFYRGIQGIEFPQLRTLSIQHCRKMRNTVSNGGHHLLCQPQEVVMPFGGCLKDLRIDWNPFGGCQIELTLFRGLEELRISRCEDSVSLIMSSIAESLVNLKVLRIYGCNEMVQVIKDDHDVVSGGERVVVFPNLQELQLRDLKKLVRWKSCNIELPSLRQLTVINCPNMKNFTTNLEFLETDLNNYIHVPFNRLKELSITRNQSPLDCYDIHGSLLNGLEVLDIFGYQGSMALFSYAITDKLVNLRKLTLRYCCEMVKVIEDKEKSGSGGETTFLFPKLQTLKLHELRTLVSFCGWESCDVELPLLKELKIEGCPNMKNFALGSVAAPNLERVGINNEDFATVDDLNGLLQQ